MLNIVVASPREHLRAQQAGKCSVSTKDVWIVKIGQPNHRAPEDEVQFDGKKSVSDHPFPSRPFGIILRFFHFLDSVTNEIRSAEDRRQGEEDGSCN